MGSSTRARRPPLAVFVLDVAEPEWLRRFAAGGRLPTVASVLERGCHGRLGGPELICEHGAARTLLSGVSRAEHGHYYFRQLKRGGYELEIGGGARSGVPPFWAHLAGRGLRVAAVDAPECDIVPGLPGLQVQGFATHGLERAPATEPAELYAEVERAFGWRTPLEEKFGCGPRREREIHRGLIRQVETKGRLAREILSRGPFDLAVVGFYEAHTATHQFWDRRPGAGRDGAATAASAADGADPIGDVFRAIDREMQRILDVLPGPADVVICSVLGMEERYPTSGLMDDFCRKLGYQAPRPPGKRSLHPVALARRLLPNAVRNALIRRLPDKLRERFVSRGRLADIDWDRTTAFSIPSLYTGFIRVNLRGREPRGIVEPGPAYEDLLGRIEADLARLIDPETGKPAVRRVVRAAALGSGGPPDTLPDLFVEWAPTRALARRIVHPRAELVQEPPAFSPGSEERLEGLIAAAGPSIAGRADLGEVSLLDVAPTCLRLLGAPVPGSMRGRPIEAIAAAEVTPA